MPASDRHPMRGLLIAQFLGAFNDNAWKLLVAFLAIRGIEAGMDGAALSEAASQTAATLAFVVFTIPLMLVSLPAGLLADRVSKRSVIVSMKVLELVLMAAGTVVLFMNPSGRALPLLVLGLMGVQSALFSPAKYGILPEIVPHSRLSAANGALEMWTFLAIIGGTAAGGILLDLAPGREWIPGLVLTVLAAGGVWVSRWIPRVPAARSEGGLTDTVKAAWGCIRGDRILWLTVFGLTFFWAIASLLGQEILVYAKAVLAVSDMQSGLLLACFGLGVGAGSWLAGKISASKVEFGLIPLGALGFSGFTLLIGVLAPGYAGHLFLLVFLGISSGLILVPLNALLQWRSPADRRGAVIALSNVLVFGGILAGSLGAEGLSRAGLSAREILLSASAVTLAGTAWALWLLPEAFLRLCLILLTHTFYRLTVLGRNNLPEKGGALLVPNHVSFVDGLFVLASTDRPVRFLIDSDYFHNPFLRPFVKALGAIPISASKGPREILRAFRKAGEYLDAGDMVCIFAEGQITRTGMMLPFRRGLERIMRGRRLPILPVYLDRVWGSIFSREGGKFVTKLPKKIPYRVTVAVGAPVPSGTPIHEIRQKVHDLGQDAWEIRKRDRKTLHRSFVSSARRHPFRVAFAEAARPRVSRLKVLAGTIALARTLRSHWKDQQYVGILLPPSIGAACTNLAAPLCGKISVNLNYTSGVSGVEAAARQSGLRTLVTSRKFLNALRLELPAGIEPLWIEELSAGIGRFRKFTSLLLAVLAPVRIIEIVCGANRRPRLDDIVTVIFSSGSTGDPKGVLLTHFNIDSNVESVAQIFQVVRRDKILGILPFFHSFGYLVLWFAATKGMGLVFHPTPLDGPGIGELVQRHRITILLTTPTFLQLYLRRCTPAQFGSLRLVVAGAEKLTERLARAFEDHFGIRPLEGYGTTECSPVIAISTLDYRAPGFYQPGSRRNFVGHPLPGVSVRIVHPESFEPLPPDTSGLLLVKGANVMRGYLGRDDLTREVLRDGWYVTGDIALLDGDGFLKITDRLSRFSKIGGEMVPLGKVEEALQEAAGVDFQVFAVTAIPDERKGERLVVLHTVDANRIPDILEKMSASGLPNIFIPRRNHFVRVEKIPVLGTGKLDLRELKRMALKAFDR
ncbi:MAG: acyl-[ACP]--phospholipid O-acyltransferase [Acidobacteriota bacterium]